MRRGNGGEWRLSNASFPSNSLFIINQWLRWPLMGLKGFVSIFRIMLLYENVGNDSRLTVNSKVTSRSAPWRSRHLPSAFSPPASSPIPIEIKRRGWSQYSIPFQIGHNMADSERRFHGGRAPDTNAIYRARHKLTGKGGGGGGVVNNKTTEITSRSKWKVTGQDVLPKSIHFPLCYKLCNGTVGSIKIRDPHCLYSSPSYFLSFSLPFISVVVAVAGETLVTRAPCFIGRWLYESFHIWWRILERVEWSGRCRNGLFLRQGLQFPIAVAVVLVVVVVVLVTPTFAVNGCSRAGLFFLLWFIFYICSFFVVVSFSSFSIRAWYGIFKRIISRCPDVESSER